MGKSILVVGSGGREHAIVWKLWQSPRVDTLYVAPGNGGTDEIAENVPIPATDITGLADFAEENGVDLTVVGPELPLALGIVNHFQARGLRIFGPTQAAAKIEGSKAHAKTLMERIGIPTAPFQIFQDHDAALEYVKKKGIPIVVKVDGLAGGKGTFVCKDKDFTKWVLNQIFEQQKFEEAGEKVVIESFLEGQELSIHALCDSNNFALFPPAQDHKRLLDGDEGSMTGGMGAIAPVPWVSENLMNAITQKVVRPTLAELSASGSPFVGCLYPGLKISPTRGMRVLEFNCRFGDPEAQVLLSLLKTDLLDLLEACVENRLSEIQVEFLNGFAVCVVLAAQGYPKKPRLGDPIYNLNRVEQIPNVVVFHAGTVYEHGTFYTAGGRVLGVTAVGETLKEALGRAYAAADLISFKGKHCRRDIGKTSLGS